MSSRFSFEVAKQNDIVFEEFMLRDNTELIFWFRLHHFPKWFHNWYMWQCAGRDQLFTVPDIVILRPCVTTNVTQLKSFMLNVVRCQNTIPLILEDNLGGVGFISTDCLRADTLLFDTDPITNPTWSILHHMEQSSYNIDELIPLPPWLWPPICLIRTEYVNLWSAHSSCTILPYISNDAVW